MRRFAITLCGLALSTVYAFAGDCELYSSLTQPNASPQTYTVVSSSRVNFVASAFENPVCPADTPACTLKPYLVSGDMVIVTGAEGDHLCATYGSRTSPNATTTGWLPASALAAKADSAKHRWLGTWRYTDEHEITISSVGKSGIALSGDASWGGHDPVRVANGGINTGQFEATVKPAGTEASFSVGDSGETVDFDPSPANYACGMHLWLREPYLVVADNLNCGGNNVSFTGIYTRAK